MKRVDVRRLAQPELRLGSIAVFDKVRVGDAVVFRLMKPRDRTAPTYRGALNVGRQDIAMCVVRHPDESLAFVVDTPIETLRLIVGFIEEKTNG